MTKQDPTRMGKLSAILYILAGVVFLAASFNPLGATPGPGWPWLVIGVVFIGMGVLGLLRKTPL
jgi:predicted membrane channel-forming protein YqfA (hemolysin III family)